MLTATSSGQIVQPAENLNQVVLDSLAERICVLDRDGTIVLANQAWKHFARDNGASLSASGPGANYLRVCWSAAGPFSEGAAEAAAGIESVLRGGPPHFSLDYSCPSPSHRAWFRLIVRRLRHPHSDGAMVISDITDRVLLAEKLRRMETHYSALIENPVDAATVLADDATIQYQSPASESVLGFQVEELVGRRIFEFVHPDDSDAVRGVLRDCLRFPGRKHLSEYRFRNKDGSWRMVESVARVSLTLPAARFVLNSRDITRDKLAEKALRAKHDALLRRRLELESLAARLFRELEEERRRTAAQLQDNLGRRLAALALQSAQLASRPEHAPGQLRSLQEVVASLGHDLRRVADHLHPAILDHLGLAVALREYCAEFTRTQGIQIGYAHRGIAGRLPAHAATTLYRVAGEALANVAKHAHTKQAWVTLSRTTKGIRLSVRDSGAGFEPAQLEPGAGLGILAMRERLRAITGSLSVRSRPGHGAEIVALVPLSPAGNQARTAVPREVIVDPLDQD